MTNEAATTEGASAVDMVRFQAEVAGARERITSHPLFNDIKDKILDRMCNNDITEYLMVVRDIDPLPQFAGPKAMVYSYTATQLMIEQPDEYKNNPLFAETAFYLALNSAKFYWESYPWKNYPKKNIAADVIQKTVAQIEKAQNANILKLDKLLRTSTQSQKSPQRP